MAGASAAIAGDVNGDGKTDLVYCAYNTNTVVVQLGTGDGTFRPPTSFVSAPPGRSCGPAAIADVNADGRVDLLLASYAYPVGHSSNVYMLAGAGAGSFGQPVHAFDDPHTVGITALDLNSDGKPDLIVHWFDFEDVFRPSGSYVVIGNGDGTFGAPLGNAIPAIPQNNAELVCCTNLNGDQHLDAVLGSLDGAHQIGAPVRRLYALLGNGDGTFRNAGVIFDRKPSSRSLGDFDGDGRVDVLVCPQLEPRMTLMLFGRGDGTSAAPVPANLPEGSCGQAADFNGDGRPDLVISSDTNVVVYLNKIERRP